MTPHTPNTPEPDLRTQLAEAFESSDPRTAWYLDRAKDRVVWVRGGETNHDDVAPEDVDDDEERFAEIPPILESDVHAWMEDFAEARGDAKVTSWLDDKAGANERFVTRLEKRDPAALAAWTEFRKSRVAARVEEWLAALPRG